jgi:PhnB protein
MAVNPVPDGYHSVTPYLSVPGASRLIEFLKQAFDAQERHRTTRPDGSIWHAELQIGDSRVMLAEPAPPWKPMPAALYLYVPDTDAIYHRALQAGASSLMEPADQPYGDRNAGVEDPSGNYWWIATHKENVSAEELERRGKANQTETSKA